MFKNHSFLEQRLKRRGMKRYRIIFIHKLEDSDKLLNGIANQMVAWSYYVNKLMLHMKVKSSYFTPGKVGGKMERQFTGEKLCCSNIHKFGNSQNY